MDLAPNPRFREALAARLRPFLAQQRWFGGKARPLSAVDILDVVPMWDDRVSTLLVLASVQYADEYPDETYAVPLLARRRSEPAASDELDFEIAPGELQDAVADARFLPLLLTAIDRGLTFPGADGRVVAASTSAYRDSSAPPHELQPRVLKVEQSNSSVAFGDRLILKLFRQAGEGINPELEIGNFLTERAHFGNVPAAMGSILYQGRDSARTLGILEAYVPNQGNAWDYTLRALSGYFSRVGQTGGSLPPTPERHVGWPRPGWREERGPAEELLGPYLQAAGLLGRRTGELHLALASDPHDPSFAPESLSDAYRVELQRSVREQWAQVSRLLGGQLGSLDGRVRERAHVLLEARGVVEQRLQALARLALDGSLTRIHGDYHLGQVLCSNNDFFIIDFEGEPARPLAERRAKHSPLQDVAGMLRSFHYAADRGLQDWLREPPRSADLSWPGWAQFWKDAASSRFLEVYVDTLRNSSLLPIAPGAAQALLEVYLLGKAIYELAYELNHRPDWVSTPLEGILDILGG